MEGGRDSEGEVSSFGEGGFGAYEEFRFITVELEEALLHPCFYCREAGFNVGHRCFEEGFGAELDLGVISIPVDVKVMADLTKREDVDDKE